MERTSNIVLHQFDLMGSWSTPAFGVPAAFQFNESDPASLVHINLTAGDYEFKLKEGDTWFGDGQEFYRDYPQHYDVLDRNDKNMKLHADVDGEYLFIFNFKLNELKVVYPAVVPAKKIAALNGAFTINAAGDKINFSRGNLQYNYGTSQWYCATEQYEMLGYSNLRFGDEEYKGSVDMFSWSCESSNFGLHKLNKDADYYGDFVDWGTKFAATEGWRTLTKAEWQYILGRGEKAWTMAAIGRDSIVGLMLFPDGWTAPTGITISYKFYDLDDNAGLKSNTFSLEQWDKLEAAGAVFLPLAGSRAGAVGNQWNGASETTTKNPITGWYCWMSNVNLMGYYWFSTVTGSNADYTMIPGVNGDWTKYTPPIAPAREKRRGNSVRLVAPATPPAKYYVTGDSALVVDAGYEKELAWHADAIKADEDTTVLNLKAGVDYKLKVTVDGTWDTALGYDNLSKKAEGLSADGDGNICFKLAEAGAVKVVYFKTGDVVTYELIGNFYIKPVIVETLNLVPNMWSEADAKMAAWVWGDDLAGAWTPFFAGEGDTLSVKINAEADSIIFVRFNSAVTAPTWDDASIWNRVKDDEIDHVGLTYTITGWGSEGISVGQWTPYEPVIPGKYYITGDSALVVDAGYEKELAWHADAIKADEDTTVLNLKAGVDYKLKVTVDGTWDTALGYNALSEKTEGLIADADDNICFKLAEAGAVQVIYFKEGDVVTFKVLGNFYIKPVIVETLNLVPNMWSEAGAKMAAWVWGEGLAGAWTPFFAGEGDTLSVKINAEADSIIFVRFNSAVTAPTWDDASIWNRVKDDEIDHVGLTYTITGWGSEGISVGQWTPYKPAGCDWDNLPWLGSALPAYVEQFKICLGDSKPGVVNIQESFGTEAGIYVTFPSAAFGQISLSAGQYAIQGAGMLLYVSAFTAKETEVSVVCENVEYVFTIYNAKGGEPVVPGKYYMKNNWNAGTEWTWLEMTPDNSGLYKLDNVVFGGTGVNYNTEEVDATATWVPVDQFLGDKIGAKDTVNFTLNPVAGTVTATLVGKYIPSGDAKYYMKNNWNAGSDWTWKEMTPDNSGLYKLENVVFGGTGVNYNTEEVDATASWVPVDQFLGDKIGAKDTVSFVLDPVAGTVTATLLGKYVDPTPGDKVYTIVGVAALVGVEWNPEATDNDMAKQADGSYKLVKENVVLEAKGYDYKVIEGHAWGGWELPTGGANQTITITAAGTYNVTFVLSADLATLTATATNVGPTPDPVVEVWGNMNDWAYGMPMTLSADKTKATISANIDPDTYEFKIMVNGEWRSNAQTFTRQNNSAVGITMNEDANMIFVADVKGDYTVTWTLANSALSIVYPASTAIENLVAPANELRKVMIDGKLYILREGKIYSVQGQLIR